MKLYFVYFAKIVYIYPQKHLLLNLFSRKDIYFTTFPSKTNSIFRSQHTKDLSAQKKLLLTRLLLCVQ